AVAGQATLGESESLTITVVCKDEKSAAELRAVIYNFLAFIKRSPDLPEEMVRDLGSLETFTKGNKLFATSDLQFPIAAVEAITIVGRKAKERFLKEMGKP